MMLSNERYFLFALFSYTEIHENDPESTVVQILEQILFTLKALTEATDNFHESKKLGEGGFGPVYKVLLFLSLTHE